MNNKIYGNIGEALAENYLKENGYKILNRNYYTKLGEIDLIAKDGNYIVFIEVKRRTTNKFGLPREAITKSKQRTIRNVALLYMKSNKILDANVRFDAIEIEGEKITHLKNCF